MQAGSQSHESQRAARDHLIASFPAVPAVHVDAILARCGHDADAALAQLLSTAEQAPHVATSALSAAGVADGEFERSSADHVFLSAMSDAHLRAQTVALLRELRQDMLMPPLAEDVANALVAAERNVPHARTLLLSGGACLFGMMLQPGMLFYDSVPCLLHSARKHASTCRLNLVVLGQWRWGVARCCVCWRNARRTATWH